MNSGADADGQISAPRWVHVFGIIVIVALVAVVLIKHLASGGLAHHMH